MKPRLLHIEKPSKIRALLARVGFSTACFFAGLAVTIGLVDISYQAGFDQGKATKMESSVLKTLMVRDQEFTRQACTAWWFDMSGKERKVK